MGVRILKSDKYFFQKLPISSIVGVLISLALIFIHLPNRIFGDYTSLIELIKFAVGNIILALSGIGIFLYILRFLSSKDFDKNLDEVKNAALNEAKRNNAVVIADFISFRPWMSDEYYVKTKSGLLKYFYPMYHVIFSVIDDVLIINELKINVSQKIWDVVGYHFVPINHIESISLTQDRIFFTNYNGDNAATVDFIEIRTKEGSIKIALFEEELLSKSGDIKPLRDEFLSKFSFLIRTIGKGRIKVYSFLT